MCSWLEVREPQQPGIECPWFFHSCFPSLPSLIHPSHHPSKYKINCEGRVRRGRTSSRRDEIDNKSSQSREGTRLKSGLMRSLVFDPRVPKGPRQDFIAPPAEGNNCHGRCDPSSAPAVYMMQSIISGPVGGGVYTPLALRLKILQCTSPKNQYHHCI